MRDFPNSNNDFKDYMERRCRNYDKHRSQKRFGFGLVILIIGIIVLLKQIGFDSFHLVNHIWPYLLIGIGVLIGIKSRFRSPASIILMIIGVVNAIPAFSFHIGETLVRSQQIVGPAILICAGLFFIFVSKKKTSFPVSSTTNSDENFLQRDIIFGGAKELVTSKEFSGGDITAIFGGIELNMVQADAISDEFVITARVIFGGVELIIPSNWEVKNEMSVMMGSVDDQRSHRLQDPNAVRKTLVLKGMCVFGGVEIKTF